MRPGEFARKFTLEIIQKNLLTPGPHDFAVRAPPFERATRQTWYRSAEALAEADQRRSSCAAAASIASRPNVRDDGQRPSWWGRDGATYYNFRYSERDFLASGLDTPISLNCLRKSKSTFARSRFGAALALRGVRSTQNCTDLPRPGRISLHRRSR